LVEEWVEHLEAKLALVVVVVELVEEEAVRKD